MPHIPAPPAATLPAANRTAALRCTRERYTAIQRDARFAPVLAQLQAAGFTANVSAPEYLADALAPFSADNTTYVSQTDDNNRVAWNSVQATRESAYWMEAFGAAAAQHYPSVRQSNFGLYGWSPEHCALQADDSGFLVCRAGSGYSALTVHAPAFCDHSTALCCGALTYRLKSCSRLQITRSLSGDATARRPTLAAVQKRTWLQDNPLTRAPDKSRFLFRCGRPGD